MARKKAEPIEEETNPMDKAGETLSEEALPLELEPAVEDDDVPPAVEAPLEMEEPSDTEYLNTGAEPEEGFEKLSFTADSSGLNTHMPQGVLPPAALDGSMFADLITLPEQEEKGEDMPPAEEKIEAMRRLKSRQVKPAGEERTLTIDNRTEIISEREREMSVWHELGNSYYTKRALTGTLDSVETSPNGYIMAVAMYKGFRIIIPFREMLVEPKEWPPYLARLKPMERLERYVNKRMGAEIDFVVMGTIGQAVAGSRRDAMLRKRQRFYMMQRADIGRPYIYPGRVVQARVVSVSEKTLIVEVFGVECTIRASDLSWEWIGDARERYAVGDRVVVRVLTVEKQSLKSIEITADIRSLCKNTSLEAFNRCKPQDKYVGRVTDNHGGVVFILLNNGANAIAHACKDTRRPGRNDVVSFVVTRLDKEKNVAIGIITRIIRQSL